MKYIKIYLSDKTPVKFKFVRFIPKEIDIKWKYTDRINFPKYIDLEFTSFRFEERVNFIEQSSDKELIERYKHLIEKAHKNIKYKKEKFNLLIME